jgi:large subunit ribosomal protein L10e|tara:strand:+ start:2919 stop:3449 length:531 start_codon:yes stop_codon:yes gene_type:complete
MGERRGGIYARFDSRPNCRKSERKPRKGYVKGIPGLRIHHFHTGNRMSKFDTELSLIPENDVQVKHTALEAARIGAGKTLTTALGEQNFHLLIRTYPHHVLRENSMATGAGADRFSSGMSKSFGRPIGMAARVRRGQKIMSLFVPKASEDVAKDALRRAKMKFPVKCSTKIEKVLE